MSELPDGEEDYYQLLGVSKRAAPKEIHHAFRRKAKTYHPDICRKPACKKIFQKLVDAFTTLKSPDKRKAYDKLLIINLFHHSVLEPARERLRNDDFNRPHQDDEWGWRVG